MKSHIILTLLLMLSTWANAQNWNLINSDRIVFFKHIDSAHISNTIIVDSIYANGGTTTYFTGYAYKECDTCNYYDQLIYRYAKECLGFSIVNDTVNQQYSLDGKLIKQQSLLNDSWTFDTGITATTVSVGQAQILGVLDSIKTIVLSTNDTIIISKNYGVIRYPDFDNTLKYYELVGYHEGKNSYGEYAPNSWRAYDFNVGDVFFFRNYWYYLQDNEFHDIKLIILDDLSTSNTVKYLAKKLSHNYNLINGPDQTAFSYYSNFIDYLSIVFDSTSIENIYGTTHHLAYDNYSPVYNFYNNTEDLFDYNMSYYDPSFKVSHIVYDSILGYGKKVKLYSVYNDSLLSPVHDEYVTTIYNHFGRAFMRVIDFEYMREEQLIGAIIDGDTIGQIFDYPDDLGYNEIEKSNIYVYPNPTSNQLNVYGNYKSLQIFNSVGEEVLRIDHPTTSINVSSLPDGIYFIKGLDENDKVFSTKLIKN